MILEDVRRALTLPRPGRAAQLRLSPRPRRGDVYPLPPEIVPREAAVMILLYPRPEGLHFFLTRRTETVETHKGQISLPGGAQERDEALAQTALREAAEEMGVDPTNVEILDGPLTSLFVPASGFRVTPFVGYCSERPNIVLAAEEVVEIIDVPLDVLFDDRTVAEEDWELHGVMAQVPFFKIGQHKVWGATGMILAEFVELLRVYKTTA